MDGIILINKPSGWTTLNPTANPLAAGTPVIAFGMNPNPPKADRNAEDGVL